MKRFKKHIRKYDEHGVAQYNMLMIFGLMIVIALSIALTAANILFSFEIQNPDANITTPGDSFWTVWMAMSTIGFGDKYPVTTGGRYVIGCMFVVGTSLLGLTIGIINSWVVSKFDKSIQNRVLKSQNDALLHKLDRLETHLGIDQEVRFDKDAHGIDTIIDQYFDSNDKADRFVTLGQDDSGRYVVAINQLIVETQHTSMKWHTFINEKDAVKFFEETSELFHTELL
ncbi:potassium voltage-gated channel subfamily A member 1 protein [Vibrio phage vB_ValM_R10Z]|nr:potassium voltage-gated channel subfamily A member 1 protein [Vibrio phage Va3]QNJ54568.1 potassium voltage-gated channel subfamily A member 1 protein [Vibrio phage vB_ValM_R10Z]QNJ54953.1 potassium voltage-gated channel subfamily A member 1 protein [Vibrio phage vB_ValM_R11Z]